MRDQKDQLSKIKDQLSRLSESDDYKLVSSSLEQLRAVVSSRPLNENDEVEVVEEVKTILNLLLEMHDLIKSGSLEPHDAFRKILSKSPEAGIYSVQIAGNVFSFTKVKFLTKAFEEIKRNLDTIVVPVVLMVMTQAEALQLASPEIFTQYHRSETYFEEFNLFQQRRSQESIGGLLERYGTTREDWQPFADPPSTIGTLIKQALDKVENFKRPLRPEFIDIQPLTDDTTEGTRRPDLKLLRKEGCRVILDVISLRHPVIQRAYRRSLLDVYPNILVVTVSPSPQASADYIKQEMIAFDDKFSSMEFYKRFVLDSDAKYCDQVFDATYFTHSLQLRAPYMIDAR